ncbi:MAG: hypothetical protein ACYDG6_02565 [Thermincolia bacterium]
MINNGNPGIRTAVWRQMGMLYGGLAGHLIGQNMDLLIQTLDKLVVSPVENSLGQRGYCLTLEVDDEHGQGVTGILQQSGAQWVECEKGRLSKG